MRRGKSFAKTKKSNSKNLGKIVQQFNKTSETNRSGSD